MAPCAIAFSSNSNKCRKTLDHLLGITQYTLSGEESTSNSHWTQSLGKKNFFHAFCALVSIYMKEIQFVSSAWSYSYHNRT
jgi:hypothetical protein